MVARRPASASPSKNSESSLVTMLIFSVVILVTGLIVGGYWVQKQRSGATVLRQQADVYESYLYNTRHVPTATQAPRGLSQAQQTRQHLLNHPAVKPGTGFDKPGVQSTGKAIVDAIDQAKGL